MPDYRKYNRNPSFRGIPFHVRDDTYTGGRRNETHEYPGGERAMTEDLGRKAHQIQLTAFVNGDDWRTQSDKLQTALEKKGPGELIHPNGKTYIVNVDTFSIRETTALREAEFTITFIESGNQPAPKPSISLSDRLISAADTLDIANAAEFIKLSADYASSNAVMVAGIAQSLVDNVASIVDSVQSAADVVTDTMDAFISVAAELSDLSDNVQDLLQMPDVWAARVKAATDIVTSIIPDDKKNTQSLIDSGKSSYDASKIDQTTTQGLQRFTAATRTNNFNMAKSATSAARIIANMTVTKRSDVRDILTSFLNNIDTALGADIAMSPEFTTALSDLSAVVSVMCNDLISRLPEETEIEIQTSVPARVLAHKLYGDQSRGDEIAAENLIANPTFLPTGTKLKVLKS